MLKLFKGKKWIAYLMTAMITFTGIGPISVYAKDDVKATVKDLTVNEVTKVKTQNSNEADLQILATSDVHGRFMPYDYAVNEANMQGSLTQVMTAVRKFRQENPNNTILVDAGDVIQDNSASLFINDERNPMMIGFNEIKYDAWTLGNHEFNYGVPVLEKIMKQFKAADGKPNSVLGGNVYKPDGSRLAAPYKIINTKGGIKVGLIGMVTPNISRWDSANLKGYKVTNPIPETKKAIKEIRNKVDVLIAVDHMGENNEYGVQGSGLKDLAEACPELDAIVGGHEHSRIPGDYYYNGKIYTGEEATENIRNNGILIVEPYKWARSISQINIKLTKKNGKYVIENKAKNITSKIYDMSDKKGQNVNFQSDKNLASKLESYNKRAIDDASKIVGELKGGDLVKPNEIRGIPTSQIEETPMINLINKVQMFYGEKMINHKIDVAATAVSRISGNIKQGKIRRCDVSLIYKFDNTIYVLKVTGKQLKKYMEWSANYYNKFNKGDLTISFNPDVRGYNYDMFTGVNYKIDISKPVGSRIVDLNKNGKPIKDTDELYMTVNDYRAKSHLLKSGEIFKEGEKLPELIGISADPKYGLDDGRIRDLIGKYIIEENGGVIYPQVQGNWKIIGYKWDANKRNYVVDLINKGKLSLHSTRDGRTKNIKSITWEDVLKAGYGKDLNQYKPTKPIVKPTVPKKEQIKPMTNVNNNVLSNKVVYIVKSGDTLKQISKKYGVAFSKIAKCNNIKNPNMIFVNQRIVIPGYVIYSIKQGDTLKKIGSRYHVSYRRIARYNNIKNVNMIFINQNLVIPTI